MSERSGVSEQSEQGGASERVSGASKWMSEWQSTSVWILGYSRQQCTWAAIESVMRVGLKPIRMGVSSKEAFLATCKPITLWDAFHEDILHENMNVL